MQHMTSILKKKISRGIYFPAHKISGAYKITSQLNVTFNGTPHNHFPLASCTAFNDLFRPLFLQSHTHIYTHVER